MAVSGNYQQSTIADYAQQFSDAAKDPSLNPQAKQIAQQLSAFALNTFTRDQTAATAANAAPEGSTLSAQAGQANEQYAADIGTLHNLERQYAAATNDQDNLSRLQGNADQTGLGTTNSLLQAAGAKTASGGALTDQNISYTGQGSADGSSSSVTAILSQPGNTTQATQGFSGSDVAITGSNSGPGAGASWNATIDGQTKEGGFYDATQGAKILANAQNGGIQVQDLTAAQKADAYVAYNALSPDDQKKLTSTGVQSIISQGNVGVTGAKDASNYGQIYNAFDPNAAISAGGVSNFAKIDLSQLKIPDLTK